MASLSPCHWWTGLVIIRCLCERLKLGPFSSSSGMRTAKGHAWVYIISGSTWFLIAHLEVWSGKHGINHTVSTFFMQWEKHYTLNLLPTAPTLYRASSIDYSHSSSSFDFCVSHCCGELSNFWAKYNCCIEWGIYFVNVSFIIFFFLYTLQVWSANYCMCSLYTVLITNGKRMTINWADCVFTLYL